MSDPTDKDQGTQRSMLDLEGQEPGASSDGDGGNKGAQNDPKPGNEPAEDA